MTKKLDTIICHYAEIGIKGGNRHYFEKILAKNIKEKLAKELPNNFKSIQRISGRILIKLTSKEIKTSLTAYRLLLTTCFGIANFSFAYESEQDIKTLKKDCWELIKNKKFKTFRITAQRSQKKFPLTSEEINREIGAYIVEKSGKKVNLNNSDINCFIEIVEKRAFIYLKKIKGPGGMPVGANGKALTLLSGGIDSPVAAYYALKRGVKTDFIHFHSMPYTSPASIKKVKDLARTLNKFQLTTKIYLVPLADIQEKIVSETPEKLRIILYRRMMLRLTENIARDKNYLALYTGESVGQVASQTLENINATEDAIKLPILRPLIGFDKEDIIEKAKEIGTYETSILPHEDCCTRFVPRHPETKANLREVYAAEKKLNIEKMTKEAAENIKTEIINY